MLFSPCGCRCGGGLCVTLTSPCTSTDKEGVTITVRDHTTGDVLATDVTDAAGHVCFDALTGTSFDVTATKADCTTTTWDDASPGDNLTGAVDCYPVSARQFRIFGCFSQPLAGANIVVTGPGSTTTALTSDGNGHAIFSPPTTGTYSFSVTHPSGRFNTRTGSWNQSTSCAAGFSTVTMGAASGYTCCVAGTPYPVKNTLNITDAGGTASFTFAAFTCGAAVCLSRTMSDVSVTGSPQALSCSPSGVANFPPSDISKRTSAVLYTITINAAPTLVQTEREFQQAGVYRLQYHGNHDVDGLCTPNETFRGWRIQSSCPMPSTQLRDFHPTSVVVNSLYPFSATFKFAAGDGFGPSPTDINPGPFSTTVVVSE